MKRTLLRILSVIGWIAAGLLLSGWRTIGAGSESIMMSGDMLFLAGAFSIVMALQALMLPHTPPQKEGVKPWAFLESMKMLQVKNFAVFIAITFVVSTELEFYYILTAPFLQSGTIGVSATMTPMVMTMNIECQIISWVGEPTSSPNSDSAPARSTPFRPPPAVWNT